MRRILVGSLLALAATAASAHGHWEYRGGSWGWFAPVVVGGVVGYELARPPVYAPAPVVVQQPVIVQQPVTTPQENCSPWVQTQQPDGSIVTTRTCR